MTCDRVATLSPVTELDTVFMAHRYFTSQGSRSWGGALLTNTAWIETWGVWGDIAPLRLGLSVLRGNIYILAGKAEKNIQMYLLSSD